MPKFDFCQGVLLFIIVFCACKSDKRPHGITLEPVFSHEIKNLVHDMVTENIVMGSGIGIAGVRPQQWDRYEKLSKIATNEQLLALTDDSNAVVRCYAFQALVERRHIDPLPVLIQHLSDTAQVSTIYGCIGGTEKVGAFYVQCMNNSSDSLYIRRLNKSQRNIVDSLLDY